MSHRPFPRPDRALHQVDRHAYELKPHATESNRLRAAIYRAYRVPPRLLGIRPTSDKDAA